MEKFVPEAAVKAGAEAVQQGYEQFTKLTQGQVEKMFPAAAKNVEEVAAWNKGTIEAAVKAGEVTAKAFEAFGKEIAAYNQASFEASVENAKAFMACKTFQDVIELQTKQAQAGFDKAVAQGTKLGEMTAKAATEAFEPINAQFNKAAQVVTKTVAA